ncbi:hypothetical protein LZ32DRAFT_614090 [Colletotrichum eremochloae]|nr:hypothetical protein LZ32DRAFT_614090 [Colletotrichum eremochloae]
MSKLQSLSSPPAYESFERDPRSSRKDRDQHPETCLEQLYFSYYRCQKLGITYAQGTWGYTKTASEHNLRFRDFLVIDKGSLRSLAALAEERPHAGLVTRAKRCARKLFYDGAYVSLLDTRAAKHFNGIEGLTSYDGVKLGIEDIDGAWFERVRRFENREHTFEVEERAGEKWYSLR